MNEAHLSNNINEQLQGGGVMNQGVSVERAKVFPWTDLVVDCTQVRANSVAMFDSANSEGERTTYRRIGKKVTKRSNSNKQFCYALN